jgi:hypothetical protein
MMFKRRWIRAVGFGLALTCATAVLVAAGLAEEAPAASVRGGPAR